MHVLPPIPIKPAPDFITHTWPTGPEMMPYYANELTEEETAMLKEEERAGQAILQQTVQSLRASSGRIEIKPILVRGDAASEIIQYAKDHEIDLIVAGARGESTIRSWLLGSVSRKLVHYANCSVLIVKQPAEKTK
jgi:nucleotide-binding universal stress UspA family protein